MTKFREKQKNKPVILFVCVKLQTEINIYDKKENNFVIYIMRHYLPTTSEEQWEEELKERIIKFWGFQDILMNRNIENILKCKSRSQEENLKCMMVIARNICFTYLRVTNYDFEDLCCVKNGVRVINPSSPFIEKAENTFLICDRMPFLLLSKYHHFA